MKRILVIYYSQSGEVAKIARQFVAQLESNADVTIEALRPRADYPYPWKSVRRFFDVMPDSVVGKPPEIEAPHFDPGARFDLVVIIYPVWFLSPAPAIQGFFRTPHAAVLRGTDVITISVSRAMWQQASEAMKRLLAAAGAHHSDNVVVTHQGSALLTLVSTTRTLLTGRSDRLMGVFPSTGVAESDRERVRALASVLSGRLNERGPARRSYLMGEPAVSVKRWLVVPELLAWYCFRAWAEAIRWLGKGGSTLRAIGVYGFAFFLVALILFALPVVLLATFLGRPIMHRPLSGYVRRLAAPTGEPETKA